MNSRSWAYLRTYFGVWKKILPGRVVIKTPAPVISRFEKKLVFLKNNTWKTENDKTKNWQWGLRGVWYLLVLVSESYSRSALRSQTQIKKAPIKGMLEMGTRETHFPISSINDRLVGTREARFPREERREKREERREKREERRLPTRQEGRHTQTHAGS